MPFGKAASSLLTLTTSLLLACGDAPTAPTARPGPVASSAPVESPLFVQFDDWNICTQQIVTYTFSGTARIQEQDGRYLLVARGTVTTSDGFSGIFNRTFVFIGDRVAHMRFHDLEVSSDTGQRQIFSVGFYHMTAPDGQPVVEFEQFGAFTCAG